MGFYLILRINWCIFCESSQHDNQVRSPQITGITICKTDVLQISRRSLQLSVTCNLFKDANCKLRKSARYLVKHLQIARIYVLSSQGSDLTWKSFVFSRQQSRTTCKHGSELLSVGIIFCKSVSLCPCVTDIVSLWHCVIVTLCHWHCVSFIIVSSGILGMAVIFLLLTIGIILGKNRWETIVWIKTRET